MRTSGFKRGSGIGHIDALLRPCAVKNRAKSSDRRRPKETELPRFLEEVIVSTSAVIAVGSQRRKGVIGLD